MLTYFILGFILGFGAGIWCMNKVIEYAEKKWREIEVIVKRKEIYDDNG